MQRAVDYGKSVKLYPQTSTIHRGPRFVDVAGQIFDATIPYNDRFFEALHRRVQAEPWLTRDKAMIDVLASIGIEKGRPFEPDTDTRRVLSSAIEDAHDWLTMKYESLYATPY
ncbi:hypothetical protein AXA44_01365 [Rhodococcus sp. SC4]|nr:hypothetical protein AXA44_01365 [Rhodococcus sp. SC4]